MNESARVAMREASTRQLDVAITPRRAPGRFYRVPEDASTASRKLPMPRRRHVGRARLVCEARKYGTYRRRTWSRFVTPSLITASPSWTSPFHRLIPVGPSSNTRTHVAWRARGRERIFFPRRRTSHRRAEPSCLPSRCRPASPDFLRCITTSAWCVRGRSQSRS